MSVDWDGKIRMDPSSPYAMQRLIGLKDKFDLAVASDTDHDRHGVVSKSTGLLPPNHFLSVCIDYLFRNRKNWNNGVAVGKTVYPNRIVKVAGSLAIDGHYLQAAEIAPARQFAGTLRINLKRALRFG